MNARERFRQIQNYALYYGRDQVEALCHYNAVIVEPSGQSEANVASLQSAGAIVLAYVSIMEIAEYDPYYSFISEQDLLKDEQEKPIKNEVFGTSMLDLSSKRWQGLLHNRIGRLLTLNKYDGVFLDTIGNVELMEIPALQRARQFHEAVDIVEDIRKFHPECILVQNNGLNALCLETVDWIDGICWENPDFIDKVAVEWSELMAKRLHGIAQERGIKMMLLREMDYSKQDDYLDIAIQKARQYGFLVYGASTQYIGLVYDPIDIQGRTY